MLCLERFAFLIVDLSFHGQGYLLQVRRQPPCSDGFVYLGSQPSLVNCTGATIERVVARWQNCSSKRCVLIGPFEPRSLQQRPLRKNYNFEAAANYHGLKVVPSPHCAENKNEGGLCLERFAFLIVDLSFHGQGYLLQVRRQPPCSDGFVYLGSQPSLVNCTGATIERVVARWQNCSSKRCVLIGPFEPRSLQQRPLRKNYNFEAAANYHGLKVVPSPHCAENKNEGGKLYQKQLVSHSNPAFCYVWKGLLF